jgi:hypothetical protein
LKCSLKKKRAYKEELKNSGNYMLFGKKRRAFGDCSVLAILHYILHQL